MAKCLITEFAGAQSSNDIQVAKTELRTQAVTYTTSTLSLAFLDETKIVRIIADADVYIKFGDAPTATANSIRIPADTVEYFGTEKGQKVACYDGSS